MEKLLEFINKPMNGESGITWGFPILVLFVFVLPILFDRHAAQQERVPDVCWASVSSEHEWYELDGEEYCAACGTRR